MKTTDRPTDRPQTAPRARNARPTLTGSNAAARRMPELRVRMRARTLDEFIARYSAFVDDDRIFICTRTPQQPGTRLRLTLQLPSGETLLRGQGIVQRMESDAARPGMEIAFVPLGDASVQVMERLRSQRRANDDAPLTELVPESSALPVNPLREVSDGAIDSLLAKMF
jgi:hypothetical protein